MKKFKSKFIIGIVFVCIIAFFFGSVCYRYYRAKRYFDYGLTGTEAANSADETFVQKDWSKKYPFGKNYEFEPTVKAEKNTAEENKETESGIFSAYLAKVNAIKESIDYYTTKLLPGRMKYVEANALFGKTVGMKIVSGSDSVVVMKNGYLTFESSTSLDAVAQAESVKWFDEIMKKKGINFMYFQYPTKEKEADGMLPEGVADGANKTADNLIERLKSSGVKCSDLRAALSQKDNDWYSNFFKTDHHWKPETGVWAAGQIVGTLNSNFGYELDTDIGKLENYNVDVYEKYCFGSQGKIATLTFADPEDISIIYPKKETNITVSYNADKPVTGRFENVLFNKEYLNPDYYNYSVYSAYLNGNKALTEIKNNDCKNGKKILIIGDSYNKCVAPYLSLAFEKVDLLDRRYFNGSVIDYIDKTEPDIVIIAYTPTLIAGVESHTATFNFE